MRARDPDVQGHVERDGVRVGYELFGTGEPAVVFVPSAPVAHSGVWKAQVPFLARTRTVVTIDPRGNGRSDRPTDPAAYDEEHLVGDVEAVLDATGIGPVVLVGLCTGAWRALLVAAARPEQVRGVVAIGPGIRFLVPPLDVQPAGSGCAVPWADYPAFLEAFYADLLPEPHSEKPRADGVGWGLLAGAEVLQAYGRLTPIAPSRAEREAILAGLSCPVLVVHGDDDRCQPAEAAVRLAELTGAERLTLAGAGHLPNARAPVAVNRAIAAFLDRVAPAPTRRWARPLHRGRRVLVLSSPIGLGHTRRDVAIADALRERCPDVRIDWLAQHPTTAVLERRGERVHPASRWLASESAHMLAEAGCAHDLHAFRAIRSMDEILVANFMVFHDLVAQEHYDLWVGDEAWELDHFLHENPQLKRSAYAWLTDFVGWVPMPDGGRDEARLTAEHNAEMLAQVARLPRLRDRAIFVGNPDDVVDLPFGPDLPSIREWTGLHYDFAGYVTGFDPAEAADRATLRAGMGWGADERVCVVTVGGSGVGEHLLRRAVAAFPLAAAAVPGLRMVLVAGPRIDPAALVVPPGCEVHGHVPDLHRMLAACDLGLVQGGLTTTMELAAARRPFLYVPLRQHFEQNVHVRHRLANYRAGRCLDWADTSPESLAAAIAAEIDRPVASRPVETGGAARVAALLAELI